MDHPGVQDPGHQSSDRLRELRSKLFEHFGKITRWKVLCQERDATTDEEKIRLAEEVLRTPSTGTVAEWVGISSPARRRQVVRGGWLIQS